jgi:hypothetical protein
MESGGKSFIYIGTLSAHIPDTHSSSLIVSITDGPVPAKAPRANEGADQEEEVDATVLRPLQ